MRLIDGRRNSPYLCLTLILSVFIDRFRYNANRAAQVQSKIKGLEKLPPLVAPEPPEDVNFSFSDKSFDKLDGNFVQIDGVSFRYSAETRWIFKVNFLIYRGYQMRLCHLVKG